LHESIPRVYGEVKEIKRKMMVEILAGKKKGIFPNQKLCFFEKKKDNSLCSQVAQATVKRPGEGRSDVKVTPGKRGKNPIRGLKEENLFIRTK